MEDKIVSYETAKLAKEIGFDISCDNYFYYEKENNDILGKIYEDNKEFYYRPEQSLLQKWIREKHLLHIEIYGFVSSDEQTRQYYYCIRNMKKYCDLTDDSETFDTYEECLESALKYCLASINTKKEDLIKLI